MHSLHFTNRINEKIIRSLCLKISKIIWNIFYQNNKIDCKKKNTNTKASYQIYEQMSEKLMWLSKAISTTKRK